MFNTARSERYRKATEKWLEQYFEGKQIVLMSPPNKVQNALRVTTGKKFETLIFVDNDKRQLEKFRKAFTNSVFYWANNNSLQIFPKFS